jgi:hypothetical protein
VPLLETASHMMLHCCLPNKMPHEARPSSSPGAPSRGHCGYGACVHHALPWLISKTSNGAGRRSLSSAHPQTLSRRRRSMCCVHLPQGLRRSVHDWLAGLPRCNYSPPGLKIEKHDADCSRQKQPRFRRVRMSIFPCHSR